MPLFVVRAPNGFLGQTHQLTPKFHASMRLGDELRQAMTLAVVGHTSCLSKFLPQICGNMRVGDLS